MLIPSGTAQADLITNGGFENTSGFNGIKQGWDSGPGHELGRRQRRFAVAAGHADDGNYLSVYNVNGGGIGYFPFLEPPGRQLLQGDGDPNFRSTPITQTITGLTPGEQYTMSFYQAAGQQRGFQRQHVRVSRLASE